MSLDVIEGTWEEIKRHEEELIGHHLRVTITRQRPTSRSRVTTATKKPADQPKKLVGYGAFKGMFGGTEAILAEKQAQIELEERNL